MAPRCLGQLRHLLFHQIDAPHAAAPLAIAPTNDRLLIAGNGGEWRAEFDAERLENLTFHQNGDERRRLGKLGSIVRRAERGIASRAILIGIKVMTTELEMVMDPTVGGEEALRMTR